MHRSGLPHGASHTPFARYHVRTDASIAARECAIYTVHEFVGETLQFSPGHDASSVLPEVGQTDGNLTIHCFKKTEVDYHNPSGLSFPDFFYGGRDQCTNYRGQIAPSTVWSGVSRESCAQKCRCTPAYCAPRPREQQRNV